MTLSEKQDLASAYNHLKDFLREHPGPHHYGGDAQLNNILYLLGKHTKDVPELACGWKDYEFIYKATS